MKPASPDEVLDLMDAPFAAAALGAAMELGLFWLLERRPLEAQEVASELGIPRSPCRYWLQLLCGIGLLEEGPGGLELSSTARTAIVDVFSQDSWALLAAEARERLPGLCELPLKLRAPGSAGGVPEPLPPTYVAQMIEEPGRARRFTRMLCELHQPLADGLAAHLDLAAVERLMDLGGGSGVVSLALLRRYPGLIACVVDVANVCAVGRQIAAENSMEERITYHAADFLRDELPGGFDVVLECDVGVYRCDLFGKVRESLNPGGRFVIVDQLAPAEGAAPRSRLHWAFAGSLADPESTLPTAAALREQLEQTGFRVVSESRLSRAAAPCERFTTEMSVLEVRKSTG